MEANVAEVSEKSKKSEILNAYHAALEELKNKQKEKPVEEQKKKEEIKLIEETKKLSNEGIIKGIADVKFEVSKLLDQIEDSMSQEFRKYNELTTAIEINEKKLSELYSINCEAETLQVLIEAQEKSKSEYEEEKKSALEEFEKKKNEKRAEWEREKTEVEFEHSQERGKIQRERDREEEEYTYNFRIIQQKDADAYDSKKAALEQELENTRSQVEKELSEREKEIAEQEQEYALLKQKAEAFPEELENALIQSSKETEERVKKELLFEMELAQKEIEGEKRLFHQEIEALKTTIEEQNRQIAHLSQKMHEAGQQVKEIAVKAVEGASYQSRYKNYEPVGVEN